MIFIQLGKFLSNVSDAYLSKNELQYSDAFCVFFIKLMTLYEIFFDQRYINQQASFTYTVLLEYSVS